MTDSRIQNQDKNPIHQLNWYLKQLTLSETPEPLRREYVQESKRLVEKLDSACRVWERISLVYKGKIARYENGV